MKKVRILTVLSVMFLVLGMGLATAGVRAFKSSPSTLVIAGNNYSWTVTEEDYGERVDDTPIYRGTLLPGVSGRTTAFPVGRMNLLTGTITVPSGAALGLEENTLCSLDLAFSENRDNKGFYRQGASNWFFEILPESPTRTVDLTITSGFYDAYASVDIAVYWWFNCWETDGYGSYLNEYTPSTLPTFTLTNVRWMLTTLAG